KLNADHAMVGSEKRREVRERGSGRGDAVDEQHDRARPDVLGDVKQARAGRFQHCSHARHTVTLSISNRVVPVERPTTTPPIWVSRRARTTGSWARFSEPPKGQAAL